MKALFYFIYGKNADISLLLVTAFIYEFLSAYHPPERHQLPHIIAAVILSVMNIRKLNPGKTRIPISAHKVRIQAIRPIHS